MKVLENVREETITLSEATRGQGIVRCPDSNEDVAWGNLLTHRTRTCLFNFYVCKRKNEMNKLMNK